MRTSVMHDVPLIGAGLVRPTSKTYGQGEYKDLINAEIIVPENVIRGRRTVRKLPASVAGYAAGFATLGRRARFIGSHDDKAVISNKWNTSSENHGMALVDEKSYTQLWNFAPGAAAVRVKGYIRYLDTSYWITINNTTNGVEIYSHADVTATFASLTKTVTSITNVNDITSVFMFKNRLWISTDKALYYSTTTFPTDFTPEIGKGGQINLSESTITYVLPYRDVIFITTPNSIFSYVYNSDPFLDGSVSQITSEVGAYTGTIYQSIPYVVGPMGLYSILNNYVEKVLDIQVEDVDVSTVARDYKLVAWDDTIFIIKQGLDAAVPSKDYVLAFNVRSRSLSRFNYRDRNQTTFTTGGFIQDMYNIQGGLARNEETLLVATHTNTGVSGTHIYFMQANRNSVANQRPFDDYYDTSSVAQITPVASTVEMVNIVPDGLEWVLKKFRHLFFEGKMPQATTGRIEAGFSELYTYSRTQDYVEPAAGGGTEYQYPRAYRMGLNQRGNALFVKFSSPTVAISSSVGNFELSNLKILWTPTARASHEKIGDGSAA